MPRTTVTPEFLASLSDATRNAPEFPETQALETLEKLEYYESLLILPKGQKRAILSADYDDGSAEEDDQLTALGRDDSSVLLTAEHASSPFSVNGTKANPTPHFRGADHGTGGLAALLAEADVQSIIPVGRQTLNVANAPDSHLLKQAMAARFAGKVGFLSLHGMRNDKLLSLSDKSQVHGVIGLGLHPNNESRLVAERIVAEAKELGLGLTIGNDTEYFLHNPKTNGLLEANEPDAAGNPQLQRGRLMAPKPLMTTNYAYRLMQQRGGVQIPSMQLEMSRTLRLTPYDFHGGTHKDRKSRALNVHLGYLLAKSVTQLMIQGV